VVSVGKWYSASAGSGFISNPWIRKSVFSIYTLFCRCCTCIQLGFLKTPTAAVKLMELVLGLICQMLLIQYGMK